MKSGRTPFHVLGCLLALTTCAADRVAPLSLKARYSYRNVTKVSPASFASLEAREEDGLRSRGRSRPALQRAGALRQQTLAAADAEVSAWTAAKATMRAGIMEVNVYTERFIGEHVVALVTVAFFVFSVVAWQRSGGHSFKSATFLPDAMLVLLPAGFQKVQNLDHLMLIVLLVVGIANMWAMALNLLKSGLGQEKFAFRSIGEVIGIALLLPCISYVTECINNYDENLMNKKAEMERASIEVETEASKTVDVLQEKLSSQVCSQASMAEMAFASRKRDFMRFLDWLMAHYRSLGTDRIDDVTNEPLLRHVSQWLRVFEETSLDPVHHPRVGARGALGDILLEDRPVVEGLKALKDALFLEDVQFITTQKRQLQDQRLQGEVTTRMFERHRSLRTQWRRRAGGAADSDTDEVRTTDSASSDGNVETAGWFTVGPTSCCLCGPVPTPFRNPGDTLPYRWNAGCFTLTLLSSSHLTVLLGVLLGPLLCAFFFVDSVLRRGQGEDASHVGLELGLLLFSIAISVIARDFESVDALLALEREFSFVQQQRKTACAKARRIEDFFAKSQPMVNFWVCRTLPLFDFLQEVQERIRDSKANDPSFEENVEQICNYTDVLYLKAGTVESWVNAIESSDMIALRPQQLAKSRDPSVKSRCPPLQADLAPSRATSRPRSAQLPAGKLLPDVGAATRSNSPFARPAEGIVANTGPASRGPSPLRRLINNVRTTAFRSRAASPAPVPVADERNACRHPSPARFGEGSPAGSSPRAKSCHGSEDAPPMLCMEEANLKPYFKALASWLQAQTGPGNLAKLVQSMKTNVKDLNVEFLKPPLPPTLPAVIDPSPS